MRLNSDRDPRRPADPSAYWRRRFLILGGGIAVLVWLAWLFSGSGPAPSKARNAAADSSLAAPRAGDTLPSAAYGSVWPGYQTAPSMPATPSASPAAGTAPASSPGQPVQSPGPAASTSGGAAGATACAPGGIVLSLFTSRASYGQDAWPQFDVYAVSTSASPCQMTFGAGAVRIVVTRQGQVVWDSTACGPLADKTVQFQLGVPQVLTVRWNRQAAGPSGCGGSLPAGASGTFDAVAMAAGKSSPVRTFRLLR